MLITSSETEYQYAERMRECWRLWNLGFPFVRPIGYQNGTLWHAETIADEYLDIDPVKIFSLIVDLYRLRDIKLVSNYYLQTCEGEDTTDLRVVPVSNQQHQMKNLQSHLLGLAVSALKLSDTYLDETSINDFESACTSLEGLELRVKDEDKDYFENTGKIHVTECNPEKVSLVLEIDDHG